MKLKQRRLLIEAAVATLIFVLLLSVTIPGFRDAQYMTAIENGVEAFATRLAEDENYRKRIQPSNARQLEPSTVGILTAENKPPSYDDIPLPEHPYPVDYHFHEYGDYFVVFAVIGETNDSDLSKHLHKYEYRVVSDENGFMKAYFGLPRYDSSNGIESKGVIYRDSYDLGWRNR